MNRIVALFLAIMYMGTTSGMVMNVHYCMGKVASVDIDNFNAVCNKCGEKQQPNCCGTETKVVKLNETHNQSINSFELKAPVAHTTTFFDTDFAATVHTGSGKSVMANAPPLLSPPRFFIKNCVFRV
ncbi:MAG: HYC_CC_PP family protein [Ilyomonas sp.]